MCASDVRDCAVNVTPMLFVAGTLYAAQFSTGTCTTVAVPAWPCASAMTCPTVSKTGNAAIAAQKDVVVFAAVTVTEKLHEKRAHLPSTKSVGADAVTAVQLTKPESVTVGTVMPIETTSAVTEWKTTSSIVPVRWLCVGFERIFGITPRGQKRSRDGSLNSPNRVGTTMKLPKEPIYKRVYYAVFSRRPRTFEAETTTHVEPEPAKALPARGSPEDLQALIPTIDAFKAKQDTVLAEFVRRTLFECGEKLRAGHKKISIIITSPIVVYHPLFEAQYTERVREVLVAQGYKVETLNVRVDDVSKYDQSFRAHVSLCVDEPLLLKCA